MNNFVDMNIITSSNNITNIFIDYYKKEWPEWNIMIYNNTETLTFIIQNYPQHLNIYLSLFNYANKIDFFRL